MALVTYILLAALHSGLRQRFNPEILGLGLSKAIAVLTVDFMVIKLGCYILNVPGQGQILDMIAYSGYKFVGYV
jgi:protein transport protein YIF1